MESLGYNFEESGLSFTEGIESNMDGFSNIRNLLKGWDAETFGVPEPHLPEMKEKLVLHAQFLKDSIADGNCDSSRCLPSTASITMNSLAEFDERLPSLANGTNDEELLLADLNVEKLESPRELKGGPVSVEESAKRARIANLQSQIPVCIVHGCNKDLSSSKEYHKRHKVCDVHSKTSVVIVNGVQQRFCQQCSRFHILAEFDNGKRSCRKRLAGHNERRRKPQLDTHFESTLYGTDLRRTSLFFSTYLQCNEPISHNTELLKFGSSHPPPFLHPKEMGKHNPSKNCPNSPLSVLELSAISNSSCAPSLLSAQSESSFSDPVTNYPLSFNPNTSMFPGILSSSSGESDQRILECGTPSEVVVNEQQPNVLGGNTVDLRNCHYICKEWNIRNNLSKTKLESGICSNHEYLMY